MRSLNRNFKYIAAAFIAAIIGLASVSAFGQDGGKIKNKSRGEHKSSSRGFCSGGWSDENSRTSEIREFTVPASGSVNVDAGRNGGVSVIGSDRSDVLIRACVQTWGKSDEAVRVLASNIRINTSGTIKAENSTTDDGWSVSYQILVPRATDLDLTAHNGGISIKNTDGRAEFETTNGGVSLSRVAGSIKGRTTNGGVNVSLAGTSWRGSGLDIQTTNGGVRLNLPSNYAANIETGTVNGGFHSDIPALSVTTEDVKGDYYKPRAKRIVTAINGGGAPVKVITTNGGIHITTADGSDSDNDD